MVSSNLTLPNSKRVKISQLVASLLLNKPSTSCVRTACPSGQQVWKMLLTICNNLFDIIRLVARLFQQVRYGHDITILLQPCVVNLVTFLLYHELELLCNKSDNATSLLQVVDSLCQTCYNNWEQAVRSWVGANTTCRQLVNRFVTTCLQTCNNLCVFTRVGTRVKISQLVNKTRCVPVVDKSGTSCYHLVTRLMRPTDSQQVWYHLHITSC
jgi:hypothetical protein